MWLNKKNTIFLLILFTIVSFSYKKNKSIVPTHFPKPLYELDSLLQQKDKITIGRLLFYDPILSADSTISCASCHSPYNAFAHTDHALSHGIKDSIVTRNAPALFNLAWKKNYMWDGAILHIDMQALAPINNKKEMGETTAHILEKLNKSTFYKKWFYYVYKDSNITTEIMLTSFSAFLLSLISCNSKYDSVKYNNSTFTINEKNGYSLFKKHCNTCHSEPLFSNDLFENNLLQYNPILNDSGRYVITKNIADTFLFKVPSLRNISFTYPYMHDGRFKKLMNVLDHYQNINDKNTTIEKLKNIHLTANDKADLVSFLKTLDDKYFIFDTSHTYPLNLFKNK